MKKALLFAFLFAVTGAVAQDSCITALPVEAGTYTVDSLDGELPVPICAANGFGAENGEWYSYTADADYDLVISTDLAQNFDRDTRIHVYDGPCDNLTCRVGDDDSGAGFLSYIEMAISEGETVYIAFDDHWENEPFDFEIAELEYVPPVVEFTEQEIEQEPGDGFNDRRLGVVDMNGDYLDDIVSIKNGTGRVHINYQTAEGFNYVNIENDVAANFPSWSMAAGDLDGNGYNDMIFGGGSGVTLMMANEDGTNYIPNSGPEYVFSQRSNCVDINNDGHLDAYVCHDVSPNVYYLNDGEGNFEFNQGGLGDDEDGGNYGSIWVDYDNDGDTDMFIAKCRGGDNEIKINEMHRNNGDGTFTEVAAQLGLADSVQTWSSAWGDYDNDGDLDVFIGASSFSDGSHKLIENNGDGTFTDITAGSGFENVSSSSIENTTHDFDNDGYLDILGINSFFHNNGNMTFSEYEVEPGNGPIGDVNNDGFLDVVVGNNGNLFLNNGNDNNYIKVNTLGTESNLNGIGAMVFVYTPQGLKMRQVRSGDGFRYMSSLTAHFGLGEETQIDSVVVNWPSGISTTLLEPLVNSSHLIEEHEGVFVGLEDEIRKSLKVYPNPADEFLNIELSSNYDKVFYSLLDISGKLVKQGVLRSKRIDISDLTPGSYLLQLNVDGARVESKIIKQ